MSNVIRLVNGGTIQVRTGVIQGIGPQGPRGLAGPQGPDGPTGPQGEQGPQGSILASQGRTAVGSNNPITANTDTVMAFGSVTYDDLSCFTSSSNITLIAAGDYQLSVWLRFDDATAGFRDVWFVSSSVIQARSTRYVIAGAAAYCDLSFCVRATAGQVFSVQARSGAATGISAGALTVTRMGSGPVGGPGPTGPQGPQGATGAAGPTGPSGSSNSGYSTYALLLPH